MSMLLRLDTPAVRRLIEDDPEFELSLTKACTVEIVRQLMTSKIGKVLELIEPAVMAEIVKSREELSFVRVKMDEALSKLTEPLSYYSSTFKLKPETKKRLDEAVAATSQELIQEAASKLSPLIRDEVEKKAEEIESKIALRVNNIQDRLINEEVDRRVKARMAAIFEASKGA